MLRAVLPDCAEMFQGQRNRLAIRRALNSGTATSNQSCRALPMSQVPQKIVSGGQTGADRAALDWATHRSIPHVGWCAKGRRAEDGPIDSNYRLNGHLSHAVESRCTVL